MKYLVATLPAIAVTTVAVLAPARPLPIPLLTLTWLPAFVLAPAARANAKRFELLALLLAVALFVGARVTLDRESQSLVSTIAFVLAGTLLCATAVVIAWEPRRPSRVALVFFGATSLVLLKPFSVQWNLPLALSKIAGYAACAALNGVGIATSCRDAGCTVQMWVEKAAGLGATSSPGIEGMVAMAALAVITARRRMILIVASAVLAGFLLNVVRLAVISGSYYFTATHNLPAQSFAAFRYHVGWVLYAGALLVCILASRLGHELK